MTRGTSLSDDRLDWLAFGAVMATLWTVPLLLGGFSLYLGCTVAIYAAAALGLQAMAGQAGQLSLGHGAFLGVGAYIAVLLEKSLGWPFLPAALVAVAGTAAAGLLMAQLVRLSGIYFEIATLGFGIIAHQVMSNWTAVTGGFSGISDIPALVVPGFPAGSRTALFTVTMVALTAAYALLLRMTHGRAGRALRAIGQDELAARSVGISTNGYRMAVITIGCAAAGLGGAFLPHLTRYVGPDGFSFQLSLLLLIMVTVGGLGSLPGAVVGAAILVVLPEYLRSFAEYKMLVFGVLLILSMTVLPRGLAGLVSGRRQVARA